MARTKQTSKRPSKAPIIRRSVLLGSKLADDHRKEIEAKELAYQKIHQELEET